MNIVVCVKQVPDNAQIKADPATGAILWDGVERILNPFDEYAIEEALRIREKHGGKVILLSMGPAEASAVLREGLSRGADDAVLCCDPAFEFSDTNATAKILARALEKIGAKEGRVDLVFLGRQTMDGDTAQVGPQLSVHTKLPAVMYVRKIEEITPALLKAQRTTDDGYEVVSCGLPAIVGTVKELNVPRLPSLKGKLRAKSAPILTWTLQDLGLSAGEVGKAGGRTTHVGELPPPSRPAGKVLKGEAPVLVEELIGELKARKLL